MLILLGIKHFGNLFREEENLIIYRPFWTLFAGIIVFTFGSLVIALNSCCGNKNPGIHFDDGKHSIIYLVIPTVWLSYIFGGFATASFAFAYLFGTFMDSDSSSILAGCLIFIMYLFLLLVFTFAGFSKIV